MRGYPPIEIGKIESYAKSYGLVHDGKVKVIRIDDKNFAVKWHEPSNCPCFSNFVVQRSNVRTMSFKTKSVRTAVKEAIFAINEAWFDNDTL